MDKMIIRIVKMTFLPDKVEEFLSVFELKKDLISEFEGCENLELVRDKDNKNIFFTISSWKEQTYLEKYRSSELFRQTWAKTKVLFSDKPQAWSTTSIFKS